MSEHKRAIVLSGGGARGAYAAGIIRYVLEAIPDQLGRPVHFDIVSGTSVGAINAAWLAATMDDPDFSVQRLWYLWRVMELEHTVRISWENVYSLVRQIFREDKTEGEEKLRPGRSMSVLDSTFFADLVRREIPFPRIQKNIHEGLLDALTITATDVYTGRTTVFVQSERSELPPWTRDPRRVASAGKITAEKVLASAAIPIVFPSIRVGGQWYFDGGLRQNTPISPALRMGADKLLVINLRSALSPKSQAAVPMRERPSMPFLTGKLLNALLLDPLDYDLSLLERINGLLEHGQRAFAEHDEDFIETLNEVVEAYRGQPYRLVDTVLFRPSSDLGELAADFASQLTDDQWSSQLLARMGRVASQMEGYRESDFLSYLLFDGGYTGKLLDLGYADARAKHNELVKFFSDD